MNRSLSALFALILAVAGCSRSHLSTTSPSASPSTPSTASSTTTATTQPSGLSGIEVLSLTGPVLRRTVGGVTYVPGGAYAASSLATLRAELPSGATGSCGSRCWANARTPSTASVYLAGPLRTTRCQAIKSVHMRAQDRSTFVLSANLAPTCAPRAESAAIAGLTLVSIPLRSLPAHSRVVLVVKSPDGVQPDADATVQT